ncbi:MAG: hypothetical protein ACLVD4_10395 [Negativibacillus sp.]
MIQANPPEKPAFPFRWLRSSKTVWYHDFGKCEFNKGVDGMTMKKIFPWLIASAAILLALPWLAVTFVKSDAGMAVSLFLFFVLNPIYAICTGAYAGRDVKRFWALPVITALFFLAGAWWFFELGESDFILYALVYLILGMAAMLLSQFVRKKRQKNLSRSNGTPIK